MSDDPMPIHGTCDPRFSRVVDEFRRNFSERTERGGAFALWYDGKQVVDIWGGWADTARRQGWQRDTIVNFFSVSKALCAIACMRLVDQGKLDLDAPVSRYWPEFSAGDKGAITARHLLS